MSNLQGKIILVTGGAGFLGSSLCSRLVTLGVKVVAFDNLSTGRIDNIKELQQLGNFKFVRGNVNSIKDVKDVFNNYKIDFVFHYAAVVGVDRTLKNPLLVLQDIEGIKNILELAYKNKVKKVVYSSSSEIYGESRGVPEKEDEAIFDTRLPYATVKAVGENYLKAYFRIHSLPTVNLRFFNVYGPRQSKDFVVSKFIKQALSGKPLTIFGDGKQTRDFVFVEDNINASLKALQTKKADGQSVNIGTGKQVTILELVKKIIETTGKKLKIDFLPARRKGDVRRRCPDITKMRELLEYTPKYSLDRGLKATYDWFKSKYG